MLYCLCMYSLSTHSLMDSVDVSLPQKVERYEHFVNERLRTDLRAVLDNRDRVYGDIAEYVQLKQVIEQIKQQDKQSPLKTMVDLGCNTYAQARVDDCSRIVVAVGLGFYLEMELDEADKFIDKKVEQLTTKAQELSKQSSEINARIKIVLEALKELQFTGETQDSPHRHVW